MLKVPLAFLIARQIPNVLTFIRLVIIVPFLIFLYQHHFKQAFYLIVLAGITDCLDGWIARYFHLQSFLGSFLDPLADKSLVVVSFISLALLEQLPWWLVVLVFLRDITISLGILAWYFWVREKIQFIPTVLSKINTALQLTLIVWCLFQLAYFKFLLSIEHSLIILTALTTSATYIDYVWTWGKKACHLHPIR